MIITERIERADEEGPCEECGFPLYVGDHAVFANNVGNFCSRHCANKSINQL